MKIGLVIYGRLETVSGGYLYDRKLVSHLRERGDTVEIISLPWRSYPALLMDNFHFRLPRGLDVLIEDELNHPSLLGANRHPHPYPIVGLVHNLHSSEQRPRWQNALVRRIEKRYLQSVDGFIFNSIDTRDSVQAWIAGGKPSVIATPGGNRLGSLSPRRIRARAVQASPLRLLFLANLTPLKGLHILLSALLLTQPSAFKVDVVGSLTVDPDYVDKMRKFVTAHGLESTVTFHGVLDGRLLCEKLEQAQVLVNPSFFEGFGIAYLEGMAFGLPAIGTRAGAIPQLITDQKTGFLIEPGDSETLSRLLQQLSEDRELLTRLSLQARQRFDQFPTWEQSAESIRTFLQQMINRD